MSIEIEPTSTPPLPKPGAAPREVNALDSDPKTTEKEKVRDVGRVEATAGDEESLGCRRNLMSELADQKVEGADPVDIRIPPLPVAPDATHAHEVGEQVSVQKEDPAQSIIDKLIHNPGKDSIEMYECAAKLGVAANRAGLVVDPEALRILLNEVKIDSLSGIDELWELTKDVSRMVARGSHQDVNLEFLDLVQKIAVGLRVLRDQKTSKIADRQADISCGLAANSDMSITNHQLASVVRDLHRLQQSLEDRKKEIEKAEGEGSRLEHSVKPERLRAISPGEKKHIIESIDGLSWFVEDIETCSENDRKTLAILEREIRDIAQQVEEGGVELPPEQARLLSELKAWCVRIREAQTEEKQRVDALVVCSERLEKIRDELIRQVIVEFRELLVEHTSKLEPIHTRLQEAHEILDERNRLLAMEHHARVEEEEEEEELEKASREAIVRSALEEGAAELDLRKKKIELLHLILSCVERPPGATLDADECALLKELGGQIGDFERDNIALAQMIEELSEECRSREVRSDL